MPKRSRRLHGPQPGIGRHLRVEPLEKRAMLSAGALANAAVPNDFVPPRWLAGLVGDAGIGEQAWAAQDRQAADAMATRFAVAKEYAILPDSASLAGPAAPSSTTAFAEDKSFPWETLAPAKDSSGSLVLRPEFNPAVAAIAKELLVREARESLTGTNEPSYAFLGQAGSPAEYDFLLHFFGGAGSDWRADNQPATSPATPLRDSLAPNRTSPSNLLLGGNASACWTAYYYTVFSSSETDLAGGAGDTGFAGFDPYLFSCATPAVSSVRRAATSSSTVQSGEVASALADALDTSALSVLESGVDGGFVDIGTSPEQMFWAIDRIADDLAAGLPWNRDHRDAAEASPCDRDRGEATRRGTRAAGDEASLDDPSRADAEWLAVAQDAAMASDGEEGGMIAFAVAAGSRTIEADAAWPPSEPSATAASPGGVTIRLENEVGVIQAFELAGLPVTCPDGSSREADEEGTAGGMAASVSAGNASAVEDSPESARKSDKQPSQRAANMSTVVVVSLVTAVGVRQRKDLP